MRLRFFGGVGEIGGNKILLESREGRVFLDFGVSFASKRRFFGGYLRPRSLNLLHTYISSGIIPRLKGIYREDLLRIDSRAAQALERAEEIMLDGCVVSHSHIDHYGHVSLLSPSIPIYLGETAKLLIEHRERTGSVKGVEAQATHYKDLVNGEKTGRSLRTFRTGDLFEAGGMRFKPVHIDHSIPASYGFVIEVPEGTLAYTGDFRMHGPKAEFTWDFIEAARGVDALLVEGTRIKEEEAIREEEVAHELAEWIAEAEGKLVAVMVSEMDFDRMKSVIWASRRNERKLVLPARLMKMLELLREAANIDVPDLRGEAAVYLERRGGGSYDIKRDYRGWLRKALLRFRDSGTELMRSSDVSREQDKCVFVLTKPESILELVEIRPEPGSLLILSTSEPHNEEQEMEREKLLNWANLLDMHVKSGHASGHAECRSILRLIEEIAPRYVIPIHTENAEVFADLIPKHVPRVKVLQPVSGGIRIP